MQIKQIGIGQLHWSTANHAPPQELAPWGDLVGNGLVKAIGVSNYGSKQLVKIYDYLKARGVPLCSAQVQFSLLSMGEEQMEIKDICDSLGIRLISYSHLGLGMLMGKCTPPRFPSGPRYCEDIHLPSIQDVEHVTYTALCEEYPSVAVPNNT
ncbi:NAD(P)-linked oxidoreductase superfamily protein, putative [Theobroma cacao]|uniref:NAD(P)-linked oxidoreductase superfamily protein, putative n=1 Tax=Theobroma cacao TaxID=3641 RepID=A0A061GAJ6_THECC|nr:NAD(P)-linked oxidoreductase superfamily protein, putative [Theobroma cacao]